LVANIPKEAAGGFAANRTHGVWWQERLDALELTPGRK